MKRTLLILLSGFLGLTGQLNAQFENPVSWKYKVNDAGKGNFEVVFTATIAVPWHVYAIKLEKEGPIPTTFIFSPGTGITLEGELKELTAPVVKYDEGFRFDVGMYSKRASFSQLVKNSSSEISKLNVSVEFQCCNDETCLPPFIHEMEIEIPAGMPAAVTQVVTPSSEKPVVTPSDEFSQPETKSEMPVREPATVTDTLPQPALTAVTLEEDRESQSLFLFLLVAFLAGLAAIITPCVFPMIPMTVSFFMRGSENRGNAVLKGLVFGFSMILVYTGIGILVSLTGMNADVGNMLSTHWIPNSLFFLLFMIFAASFLGMFELVLPSGLVNSADRNADRGGLAGAFFMGITTVLVSFSCTGPIVGSLLISAAGGEVMKPILGMFFFSLAFALPFTLLAIFPSMMKNLPKSGGWLNSVKVVLGFIVLAFGLKFLSNMDQSYHLGIFSREVYLAIWMVISILLGMYLLGKLKFAHDSELPYVSVPRLMMGTAAFVFAVYLMTGIFGADLKTISPLIPPKSASAFRFASDHPVTSEAVKSSTFCGPGKYDELFELPHGLNGYFTYEDGMKCAKELNKPVFLDFTGHFCSNCKQMENQVWPDPEVLSLLKNEFVIISLYTDDKTKLSDSEWITTEDGKTLKTLGDIHKNFEIKMFKTLATPLYVLLSPEGEILASPRGKDLDPSSFATFLKSGIEQFNKDE